MSDQDVHHTDQYGFTLIEVMIVVSIVAILAAIALPSYQNSVKRANRADAKALLTENAQFLERNFTEANRYDKDAAGNDVVLPRTESPRDSSSPMYAISLTATASIFTLTATPIEGSMMDGDTCGSFTLNQLGQKKIIVNGTVVTGNQVKDCWNR
jgi:type IV pilus assembly protein PilE